MGSKNSEAPMAATNEASDLSATCKELTMNSLATQISTINVPFHGDNLYLVNFSGQPYVPMKPVVEGMGLAWGAQFVKIKQRFNSTISEIEMVALDGKNRQMTCLPLRKLPGWLHTINVGKVRPELREKVARYQEECDDVLYQYWTKGEVKNPRKKTTVEERTPLRDAVNMLVGKKGLRYDDAYNMVHQRFGIDSIDELDLDQIPQAIEYIHRVVLEGELLEKQKDVKCLANYNFPIESADPHDRRFGNDWVSAKVILDERNRAPELELIEALEKDGFDVSGIKVRIYAMYDVATRYLEMQSEFSHMKKTLSSMLDIAKYQSEERGINIIFSGTGRGGQIGGFKQRRLPR